MTITIKAPATSANIGIGFDTLAMALNMYNELSFKSSEEDCHQGFQKKYQLNHNLAYLAYLAFYERYGNTYQPVTIEMVHEGIPISRGLGSSASLILAGVLASNLLNQIHLPFFECVSFAANYEGHPDNIFACAYGGLISVFKTNDRYIYQHLHVSDKYFFHVLIPSEKGSTKTLRKALPTHVSLADAAANIAKMSMLPRAFESGDITLLNTILNDSLHEPYRIPILPNQKEINTLKSMYTTVLSGSGPTILMITHQAHINIPKEILLTHQYHQVHLNQKNIEVIVCE